MKLLIVDLNKELVSKVKEAGYEAINADYFSIAYQLPFSVLMTASNPRWTFGGGIDYAFSQHFPRLANYKKIKGGGMERIGNIIFTITVDNEIRATSGIVKEAIDFAIANTLEAETLLVSGCGTGIGGMSIQEFIGCLPKV